MSDATGEESVRGGPSLRPLRTIAVVCAGVLCLAAALAARGVGEGIALALAGGTILYLAQAANRGARSYARASEALDAENRERVRAEAELREADDRLLLALESSGVGTYEWDLKRNHIRFDKYLRPLLGMDPKRTSGSPEHLMRAVHPNDRARLRAEIDRITSEQGEYETQFRAVWPDGRVRWLASRGKVFKNAEGAAERLTGACWDVTEAKEAERELRESEERLQAILDNSTTVIYLKNLDGRYLLVNESYRKLLGITDPEIIGRTDFDLWSPELAAAFQANDRFVAESGEVIEFEEWAAAGDDPRLYLSIKFPVRADDGRIYAVGGISTDITDRKRAEVALGASQERLRVLFEGLDDALFVHDEHGYILDCNEAACRRLGYTREEFLKLRTDNIDAPEFALGFAERMLQQMREGRHVCEGVHMTKDGRHIPVHINTTIIEYYGKRAVLAVARDLGELKRLERRFEQVVEGSPYGVVLVNSEGRIELVNTESEILFGYPRKDLVGAKLDMLLPPAAKNRHAEFFAEYFRNPRSRPMALAQNLAARRRDGTEFPVEISLAPVPTNEGTLVLASINDISARKAAEEEIYRKTQELGRLNADLQRSNEELNQFAHVASHDLQEPLRTIITYAGFLREDLDGDISQQTSESLDLLTTAARRMRSLVQDLLEFSRSSRGDLRLEWFPLEDCIQSALFSLQARIAEKRARIESCPLPKVHADKSLLTQVFQNLIGNAVKFRKDADPLVQITAEEEEDAWVFGVKDNGIGIPPEFADQVFVPFKRLHHEANIEGTGIGLAICQKIVERHGGVIWVESEPGAGSHFKFRLPQASVMTTA